MLSVEVNEGGGVDRNVICHESKIKMRIGMGQGRKSIDGFG
jgi:hypothetical protein